MSDIEIIAPVQIADTDVSFAQAVKAGNWIFLTGHEAIDHATGLAPQVRGEKAFSWPWHAQASTRGRLYPRTLRPRCWPRPGVISPTVCVSISITPPGKRLIPTTMRAARISVTISRPAPR